MSATVEPQLQNQLVDEKKTKELSSEKKQKDSLRNFTDKNFLEMLINQLPQETFDHVCGSLDDGLGTGWSALMTNGFAAFYSADLAAKNENSGSPARKLLYDLRNRHITVEELLEALNVIGNKEAITKIMEGVNERGVTLEMPPMLLDDHPFPRQATGQPREHHDAPSTRNTLLPYASWEQAKSSKRPVQETGVSRSLQSTAEASFSVGGWIASLFPCFFPLQ